MTVSPQKHESDFTTSTANRGVEAKEREIVNVHLDSSTQPSSQPSADRSLTPSARPPPPPSPPSRDDSASYIQVLVQKQRRRRESNAPPRLARPSSPVAAPAPALAVEASEHDPPADLARNANFVHTSAQAGCGACRTWPAALLACPALAALHHSCGAPAAGERAPAGPPPASAPRDSSCQNRNKMSLWRKMSSVTKEDLDSLDGPERLDVYRFETGDATLSARGPPPTRLERALRRSARPAARLLAELLTAPRLLAALPTALLLLTLRTALTPLRDAVVGVVQTASDYALKPALALTFNALLQPVLVCAAQSARALRDALRPLALALGDATEPAARLLAALRLVQVERRCSCTHAV